MLRELVESQVREALKALEFQGPFFFEVKRADRPEHGDFSTNVAFALAKAAKQTPRALAERVVGQLRAQRNSPFETVNVAGAGFINFKLKITQIQKALTHILGQAPEEYCKSNEGEGKTAQVEFVSANPTGPLTLGHGRQAVLGDVIARLLENAGYRVTREFYYNNAGSQMQKLAQSVQARYLELLQRPSQFPEDGYQGEYIREIAQRIAAEQGESWINVELDRFKDYAEAVIFEEIRRTLGRLFRCPPDRAFDVYYNETSLYGQGPQQPFATINQIEKWLRAADLAYDKDGAVWFRATALGRPEDRVIVRRTGEPTYRLPDITYHLDKLARGFDLVVDIFGSDHHDTYQDVIAALKGLCTRVPELKQYDPERIRVLIHQFVTLMRRGQPVKMSKRIANYVTIDELIDEIKNTVVADSKLEEAFAVNAVRYFFLMRNPDSHLEFDLDLAKAQSKENPVYYLMYAKTRISAINGESFSLGKFSPPSQPKEVRIKPPWTCDLSPLQQPEELALIKQLDALPEVLIEALHQLKPSLVTSYAFELAQLFHDFYEKHRVLDATNQQLTDARMALLDGVDTAFERLFGLMGLFVPSYM
jgi:arginyl-tRNA synthetase